MSNTQPKKPAFFILLLFLLFGSFFIQMIKNAEAQSDTVHFICYTMNRGNQGSITFSGSTYVNGQSAVYSHNNYLVTGNPPAPTSDWKFCRWVVMWLGSQSWVDNPYSQTTTFHLRGECWLEADFYCPIITNSPTSPVTWGSQMKITGTANQYSGQPLSIVYYPDGSGMGPPNELGQPPFGGSGYSWTTVTVNSGSWDTGWIYPTLPISLGHQLPKTYKVYAGWAHGSDNEVDSNVVSFTLNPATAQIAAPDLSASGIILGQSVTITDQIFSSAFVNGNDMTGTLTVQIKKQGDTSWTNIASQGFTSSYGYSDIYSDWGVYYDLSKGWTPTETGIYDIRVTYSGNNLYSQIDNPPFSTLTVSEEQDFGISIAPTYRSLEGEGTEDYIVTVTSINGFNSEISLGATSAPSEDIGLTFIQPSITPPPDGSAQTTLQVTTTSMTPLDDYLITVTGSGGGKEHSTSATLSVRTRSHYTIVFVPLNWQGYMTTFYDEVLKQASFLIDSVEILTWANTEIRTVGSNFILDFDKTGDGSGNFNHWADIAQFATSHGVTGDRYVALTDEEIWVGDEFNVEGLSDGGPIVVVERGAAHITAHELGHTWGLLDEYNYLIWLTQAAKSYDYPTGFPPNSYPGDDPDTPGRSLGRAFDGHRCIMGTNETEYENGDPIDRAFCTAHSKDEGIWGVREYEGCAQHVEDALVEERAQISAGLVRTVVTFFKNGSAPIIHEITGLDLVGKPFLSTSPQNYSMQIYSPNGDLLYNSNISYSFWNIPCVPINSNITLVERDEVTVTWIGAGYSQENINVTLTDNIANQTIATQNVTVPPIIPDVAVLNVIPSRTLIHQGFNVEFSMDVQNEGNRTETFNATIFANASLIGSQEITLLAGNFTTLTFHWNTTGVPYGNYTIAANVTIVPGETDVLDNDLTYGIVWIKWPYDITGDNYCGIDDIIAVAEKFGTEPGHIDWHRIYDVNDDDYVGIDDIIETAEHFGESV